VWNVVGAPSVCFQLVTPKLTSRDVSVCSNDSRLGGLDGHVGGGDSEVGLIGCRIHEQVYFAAVF
jgi:hypothetical protein